VIDEKEVTAYVTIPDCFLQGCSEDIVIFRADGGNHFTDYGIYEGMFHVFQMAMLLMPESKKAWAEIKRFLHYLDTEENEMQNISKEEKA